MDLILWPLAHVGAYITPHRVLTPMILFLTRLEDRKMYRKGLWTLARAYQKILKEAKRYAI